jgi:hypothetical protein
MYSGVGTKRTHTIVPDQNFIEMSWRSLDTWLFNPNNNSLIRHSNWQLLLTPDTVFNNVSNLSCTCESAWSPSWRDKKTMDECPWNLSLNRIWRWVDMIHVIITSEGVSENTSKNTFGKTRSRDIRMPNHYCIFMFFIILLSRNSYIEVSSTAWIPNIVFVTVMILDMYGIIWTVKNHVLWTASSSNSLVRRFPSRENSPQRHISPVS